MAPGTRIDAKSVSVQGTAVTVYQGTSFTPERTAAGVCLFRAGMKVSAGTCEDLAESLRRHERNRMRWRCPSSLNRLIQRRTVAGWQSSNAAICADGNRVATAAPSPPAGLPPPVAQIAVRLLILAVRIFGEHADRAHTDHDLVGLVDDVATSIQSRRD